MSSIKNVSGNLRRLRIVNGLSQVKLAEISGVSANEIHLFERKNRTPSLPTIEKLAKALKVEPISMFMKRCKPLHRGGQPRPPSIVVADNITMLRLERLITQAKLGGKIGISHEHVCALERGNQVPRPVTLQRISKALEIKNWLDLLRQPTAKLRRIKQYTKIGSVYTHRGYVTE